MKSAQHLRNALCAAAAALLVAGCAAPRVSQQQAHDTLKTSFVDRGQAKLDKPAAGG